MIRAAPSVMRRETKRSGRRGDSWLNAMPATANTPKSARNCSIAKYVYAFAAPYGDVGRMGVSSLCGHGPALPNISLEHA